MKLVALLFSLSIFVVHTSYANTPTVQVSKGYIEVIDNIESQFVKNRFLNVWLPPGYNKNTTYDVLYMHDGRENPDHPMHGLYTGLHIKYANWVGNH